MGETFGATGAICFHGEALLVVLDAHHAALLCQRRAGRAAGQHHVDGATVDLDVPSLSDVNVLREERVKDKLTVAAAHDKKVLE